MISLSISDIVIIGIYFLVILTVGFRAARGTQTTTEEFLLAGRSLTLPVFVMTLVSTWYGGILGVGEFSYRYGISSWVVQGVPYYVFAGLFAAVLAKRIRAANLVSIPDKLQDAYGTPSAVLGSALTFILMTPAPYILMLSVFLQMLFGWSLFVCILVTTLVAVSYIFAGGFRSDVHTDVVEFILMFGGFAIILPFCFDRYGGMSYLESHLPATHLVWHGGNDIQFILVWFFIALWTLVDPSFHQRCSAAKDGRTAQLGIFLSIGFWLLFDTMTATAGLYARASLPNLQQPIMSYPLLAEATLPPIAKGLFYVGMLATIMSTLNSLALISAQTLGKDIVLRVRPAAGNSSGAVRRNVRIGLVISLLLSIGIALILPSVVQLWYTIGTVIVPGLLIPLMASYFPSLRIPPAYAFASMALAFLASAVWMITGWLLFDPGIYPLGIEPMYPGLAAGGFTWLTGRLHLISKGDGNKEG